MNITNSHINSLNVVVDGIIFCVQSNGGISRIYQEILPRMCDLNERVRIKLITENNPKQDLPKHTQILLMSAPYLEISEATNHYSRSIVSMINRMIKSRMIGNVGIWHSTYYTYSENWKGNQIVTVYDMVHELFPKYFGEKNYLVFRKSKCIERADYVICISETTRRDVKQFYNLSDDKLITIPLACNDNFRQTITNPHMLGGIGKTFILYVGERRRHKNFDWFVKTFATWPSRNLFSLVVIGKPWTDDEQRQLVELGVEDRVVLIKNVNDESLCALYNQACAFIYPSLYEGFGLPLLEAMACGCPIVASKIPTTVEIAQDCPFYFDLNNEESLLAALDRAVSEGRESLNVSIGLERVKHYSWDVTAKKTLEVYESF